ncbi:hypothetical protein HispidOSU_003195 [Sigmodon hispidus]
MAEEFHEKASCVDVHVLPVALVAPGHRPPLSSARAAASGFPGHQVFAPSTATFLNCFSFARVQLVSVYGLQTILKLCLCAPLLTSAPCIFISVPQDEQLAPLLTSAPCIFISVPQDEQLAPLLTSAQCIFISVPQNEQLAPLLTSAQCIFISVPQDEQLALPR